MKVQPDAVASPGLQPAPERAWSAAFRTLQRCAYTFRDDTLATTFPDDCRICAGPLTAWSAAAVCTRCIGAASPHTAPLCTICGEALGLESARFAAALGVTACAPCRLAPPPFARAVAYGRYEDELRDLLHLFKYAGARSLAADPLGHFLASALAPVLSICASQLTVIAVPLFVDRQRQRGFNQSALLAEAAVQILRRTQPGIAFTTAHAALQRTRDTREQFALDPRQRRSNLRGAFAVADPETVRGREIVLVDDIMTTGATARECARVLLRAGAAKVWVATVARAQAAEFTTNDPSADVARWDTATLEHTRVIATD